MISEGTMVGALLAVHGGALALSGGGLAFRKKRVQSIGVALLWVALAINTFVLAGRWMEAGRAPFKTLYETMLFYPWCVALVTGILLMMYDLRVLVPFSAAACIAGLVYAMVRPDIEIVNLPPALQSPWFVPHVVTYFVAYAALFASFVLAGLALLKRRAPEVGEIGMDEYAHRAAMFGFTALTFALAMGALWAKAAWGDYWSWDPKENWALVSFLAYLTYFHLRFVRGWRGRPAMAALTISFATVVFTYLGMALLPSATGSLHVYQ